ncbi:MAG: beta-lactamase family protein [Gemmatimonadota bacterium]|nr:beta-lactamase family protein [Gemmatimonadota bacterium]
MSAFRRLLIYPLVLAMALAACAPAATSVAPPATAASTAPAPAAGLPGDVEARLDSIARAIIAGGQVPGLTVAVAQGDQVAFARGYGAANREQGVQPTAETVFRTGSVTKQFTAAAILRLAEQGKLDLDDPIAKYLPDFPTQGHTVTVSQLLNHTSGIKSYTGLPQWRPRMHETLNHEQMLAFFVNEPFDFAPGEQWRYNNSGYYLLGMIVERVTGQDYPTYIQETFFRPLGLQNTSYCPDRPAAGHAEGYSMREEGPVVAAPISMTSPFSAGAICSTVLDLVRWNRALVGGRVVSPVSYRAMITPDTLRDGKPLTYGYGLGVSEWEGMRRVHHGGGIPGFGAYLAYYPERDVTIAVLQNTDSRDPALTEDAVARAVLGIAAPEVKDLPLSAAEGERYAGTYDLGPMQIRVFVDGERVMAQGTGQPAFRLLYQGNHEFRASFDERTRLVFEVSGERAESFTLYQGGATMPARRVQ